MRTTMRFAAAMPVCAVLALLVPRVGAAQAAEPGSSQDALRQVAIMAKVIETRLKEELPDDLVTGGVFEPGGVRGFRVPGVGVVFLANVKFALSERKREEEEPEQEKDDLWKRIERGEPADSESARAVFRSRLSGRGRMILDPKRGLADPWGVRYTLSDSDRMKIETMESEVVETLAEYGDRLTAVEPDENIIILIGSVRSGDGLLRDLRVATIGPAHEVHLEIEPSEGLATEESTRELRDELRSLERSLEGMEKQLKETPDSRKLEDVIEAHKARLRVQKDRIEELRRRRPETRRMVSVLATDRGAATPTSWILTVKKRDLIDDPAELRKRVEIGRY